MWKPVERKRIAEEVARQLRGLILQGRYKPGDKLPPERKLSETLGVNRATLREALRNLEHMGLVRIRQGDGTRVLDFIQTAGLDLLGHLVPVSGAARETVLRDLLEFREIAGREMARLAATRATPAQLDRLHQVVEREVADDEASLIQDLDFYFELARSTGNLVFPLLYNPMRTAIRRVARLFAHVNPGREAVRRHQLALMAALTDRDPERATRIAAQHLAWGREHMGDVGLSAGEVQAPAPGPAEEAPVPGASGDDPGELLN